MTESANKGSKKMTARLLPSVEAPRGSFVVKMLIFSSLQNERTSEFCIYTALFCNCFSQTSFQYLAFSLSWGIFADPWTQAFIS